MCNSEQHRVKEQRFVSWGWDKKTAKGSGLLSFACIHIFLYGNVMHSSGSDDMDAVIWRNFPFLSQILRRKNNDI